MGYTVLPRKWRPQSFSEVVGQEHVVRALQNALAKKRIGHAYLFAGPRGVGKTTVARILAKALNCEKGPTPDPCNRCTSCMDITKGTSIDVIEIDGASNTSVDDVREIKESVRYLPSGGRYKVYIVDEVHMLSASAFNALLKTLEEPPPHIVFVFATTEPHKIPATILSRCQRFDFKRLTLRKIRETLKGIAEAEGIEMDDKALLLIAREADGSMRDAQVMLDQIMAFKGERVDDKDVVDLFGLLDRDLLFSMAEAILAKDQERCVKMVEKIHDFGYDEKRFWQELIGLFRDLLIIKTIDRVDGVVELSEEEVERWKGRIENTPTEELQWALHTIIKGYEEFSRSFSPRLALEVTLLKITTLPSIVTIHELIKKVEGLAGIVRDARTEEERRGMPSHFSGGETSGVSSTGLSDPTNPTHENQLTQSLEGESHGDIDRKVFLDFVRKRNLPIFSHLEYLTSLKMDGNVLLIEMKRGIHFDRLLEKKDELEGLCKDFFQKDVVVLIKEVKEDYKDNGGDVSGVRGRRIGAHLKDKSDTFIKDVLEIFNGRVYKDIKVDGGTR